MKNIIIYTDGACSGNPGKGGFGYYAFDENNINNNWKGSQGVESTTNQRMELTAAIVGLSEIMEKIKERPLKIKLYTDSAYLSNCIKDKWYIKWEKNGWKNTKGEPVKNQMLWKELLTLILIKETQIEVIKIKGHSGNKYNEIVDKLAKEGIRNLF